MVKELTKSLNILTTDAVIQLLHYVISAYKPEITVGIRLVTQWYVPFTFYLLYILLVVYGSG